MINTIDEDDENKYFFSFKMFLIKLNKLLM